MIRSGRSRRLRSTVASGRAGGPGTPGTVVRSRFAQVVPTGPGEVTAHEGTPILGGKHPVGGGKGSWGELIVADVTFAGGRRPGRA